MGVTVTIHPELCQIEQFSNKPTSPLMNTEEGSPFTFLHAQFTVTVSAQKKVTVSGNEIVRTKHIAQRIGHSAGAIKDK
jgi:hypothetical protein